MEDITTHLSCLRAVVDEVGLPCDQQSWNVARALGLRKELTQHSVIHLTVNDISCYTYKLKNANRILAVLTWALKKSVIPWLYQHIIYVHCKLTVNPPFVKILKEFNNPPIIESRNMPYSFKAKVFLANKFCTICWLIFFPFIGALKGLLHIHCTLNSVCGKETKVDLSGFYRVRNQSQKIKNTCIIYTTWLA